MTDVPRVCGLDLSLSGTGYAVTDDVSELIADTLNPGARRGAERLSWLRDEILHLEHEYAVGMFAVEGYSYGSANRAHQMGELGGVVRCALWDAGIGWVDVAPAAVKRYATGRGNAPKAEVLTAAVRRLGYDGHDDNVADALWLRALLLDRLGGPVVEVPESHRTVLDKIDLEAA